VVDGDFNRLNFGIFIPWFGVVLNNWFYPGGRREGVLTRVEVGPVNCEWTFVLNT
jgi:hypothetical protein